MSEYGLCYKGTKTETEMRSFQSMVLRSRYIPGDDQPQGTRDELPAASADQPIGYTQSSYGNSLFHLHSPEIQSCLCIFHHWKRIFAQNYTHRK